MCKAAKADNTIQKLRDGNGLYLYVKSSNKYWRWDYKFAGKRKTLSIGVYPKVSLKQARIALFEAKEKLDRGIDPSYYKQLTKYVNDDHRLITVALEWLSSHDCTDRSRHDIKLRLEKDVFPIIGDRLVQTIEPVDVLHVARRIESRGAHEVARRTTQNISQVMRYALALGLVSSDPCRDLKGAIKRKRETKRFAAITNRIDFGELLRTIDTYDHSIIVGYALKISPHVAARPAELREAPWHEIDLDARLWTVPAERMKKDREHFVPLSDQVVKLLGDLKPITSKSGLLFPSPHIKGQPFAENTLNNALKRIGYTGKIHTPHGFRSSFSTMANESGLWSSDIIEAQLSHLDKDRVRAAYNRADHLEARTKMMQWWSDQIDIMRLSSP